MSKMKGKFYLFILLLAIVSFFLYKPYTAAPKDGKIADITGKITDRDEKPVAKVGVALLGSNEKVYSDRDGEFTIKAGANAQLVVTHSKYRTQEVSIGGKERLYITILPIDSLEAQIREDFPEVELVN